MRFEWSKKVYGIPPVELARLPQVIGPKCNEIAMLTRRISQRAPGGGQLGGRNNFPIPVECSNIVRFSEPGMTVTAEISRVNSNTFGFPLYPEKLTHTVVIP